MEEEVARRKEQPQTGHRSTRPSLRLHSVEATTQQLIAKPKADAAFQMRERLAKCRSSITSGANLARSPDTSVLEL
jgi:hypothetical protein